MNLFWDILARKEWLRRIDTIRKSTGWGVSDLFKRCQGCGSLTVKGRCVKKGIVVACCECKRFRSVEDVWHTGSYPGHRISHTICPECHEKLYPGMLKRIEERKARDVQD